MNALIVIVNVTKIVINAHPVIMIFITIVVAMKNARTMSVITIVIMNVSALNVIINATKIVISAHVVIMIVIMTVVNV